MGRRITIIVAVFVLGCSLYARAASLSGDNNIIKYLEFREVDIKDVLRQLAKQYNINIVFSEAVKGAVTVQLNNISLDEALDAIITVNGYVYIKKDNVIKVTTPQEAEHEGTITKLFKLNNADASHLKDTLIKVLSSKGSIDADKRSNSLVITDAPSVINKIERMLPDLDRITSQVLIEARFIETSLDISEKLGIDWSMQVTAKGGSRPATFPFKPSGNKWMKNVFPPLNPSDSDYSSSYGFPYAAAGDFIFGVLDFSQFMAIFDFLKTRQNSKLVANPSITTLDNKEASINVGKVIPLANYTYNADTGSWEITGWDEYNVGVSLKVTPHVSPDGHIKLNLNPEVSNVIDWIGEQGDLNRRPVTSTRIADTQVQIRDGQTVVIGGLIKNKTSHTVKKVPLLGDLPIIGLLFTRTEESTEDEPSEQTDLLIFVTAHILKDTSKPMIGYKRSLITASPKPFKLELRNISTKK